MATPNKKRSVSTASATNSSAAPVKTSRSTVAAEFNPDYTYVKKDLTRIAILAGSFITILVILSFFLR
ncbi:MAG: hypothetical protein C0410_14915 [Anaerolinea sp.]|nr:hypothetical protein [Anaerolinea sp.]